jgi:hypothetical protein
LKEAIVVAQPHRDPAGLSYYHKDMHKLTHEVLLYPRLEHGMALYNGSLEALVLDIVGLCI